MVLSLLCLGEEYWQIFPEKLHKVERLDRVRGSLVTPLDSPMTSVLFSHFILVTDSSGGDLSIVKQGWVQLIYKYLLEFYPTFIISNSPHLFFFTNSKKFVELKNIWSLRRAKIDAVAVCCFEFSSLF